MGVRKFTLRLGDNDCKLLDDLIQIESDEASAMNVTPKSITDIIRDALGIYYVVRTTGKMDTRYTSDLVSILKYSLSPLLLNANSDLQQSVVSYLSAILELLIKNKKQEDKMFAMLKIILSGSVNELPYGLVYPALEESTEYEKAINDYLNANSNGNTNSKENDIYGCEKD